MDLAETTVIDLIRWLRLIIESIGALIIAIGFVVALAAVVRALFAPGHANFTKIRIDFARYLALALEFQLGADVLSTAVAPSWDQIGKLAAIAVIRTGLNYFLIREMNAESAEIEAEHSGDDPPS